MTLNTNKITVLYIALVIAVLMNYIAFPNMIFIQLFSVIYLTLAYKKFASNCKEMIYYSTLLFAIVNFSLEIPITSRYSIYYFYVTLFIYMVWTILSAFKDGKLKLSRIKFNKYMIFIFIFCIYMIFSVFLSVDKKLSIKYIYNFSIMLSLLIMMVLENKNKNRLKSTLSFLAYVYVGVLFLGLLEIFGVNYGVRNHFEEWDPVAAQISYVKRIPVTLFYNPNNYAVFLVIGMILLLMQIIFGKNSSERWKCIVLYLVAQINLIFTRSRTAWITIFLVILFCIGFYLIKKFRDKQLLKKLTGAFIITFLVFFLVSLIPFMQPFYGKMTGSRLLNKLNIFKYNYEYKNPEDEKLIQIGKKGSDNQRFTLIYDVVNGVIVEKNYLGFGAGNIEKYVEKMDNTFGVFNIHSLWFETLGNFGVGIFIYLLIIYSAMVLECLVKYCNANRERKKYLMMGSSATFGFIFLAFAPSTIMWFTTFWIILGITISLITSDENNKSFIES